MRPFIISSLLLPSPLGGVRGGNNRHQVLVSLFSVCLLKYYGYVEEVELVLAV